ncbi:MAG: cyclic lactone autoinducer peptide [Clostridiaceae bacterium]|jgi:cyclic lactone autoinducer peptide|nr:cyclic lactone autoinducer peptide [Clostridiaceae bacterium]
MKGKMLGVVSAVLVVVSMVSASTASWLIFYQPKAPKTLHK